MALRHTGAELDLITDPEADLMLQNSIRGGITTISQRHASANNKYVEGYDESQPTRFITYLDANSLYTTAQRLARASAGRQFSIPVTTRTSHGVLGISDKVPLIAAVPRSFDGVGCTSKVIPVSSATPRSSYSMSGTADDVPLTAAAPLFSDSLVCSSDKIPVSSATPRSSLEQTKFHLPQKHHCPQTALAALLTKCQSVLAH